jgi:hypothetical protein
MTAFYLPKTRLVGNVGNNGSSRRHDTPADHLLARQIFLALMTERKPLGMSFTSWIDQQISEATERGAFDDLPGAGKPLPKHGEFDGETWLRDYTRREGGSVEYCLPAPLRLRKEIERLPETVSGLRDEQQVRDMVEELNDRIMQWRRLPVGPPIFVPLVDADAAVAAWQERRAARPEPDQGDAGAGKNAAADRRSRWRISRRATAS